MTKMLIILFSAILVNNFVLSQFLGICPFLGVSKNLKTAMGMSTAVIFVLVLASAITWPIYTYLLLPLGFGYLQTIIFILVIAALVQIIETFLKKSIPVLYRALGIYLPLITTNCAVLGVTILNINESYSFLESIVNSLGAGFGFMLALFLFAGVRSRTDKADIPKFLQGLPSILIAASLVSISFFGFKGLIERIFGQ
jgi:electron transport complex protein RnfA